MAESAHKKPEIVTLESQHVAVVHRTVPMSQVHQVFDEGLPAVMAALTKQGVTPDGPPLAIYHGTPSDTVSVSVGFPTAVEITAEGDVHAATLPGGEAAGITHVGSYDSLSRSYARLQDWMTDRALVPGTPVWEIYVTEPNPEDPSSMVTEIRWPFSERMGGLEG